MPFATLKDTKLYYELVGPETASLLVLSNSLGTNLRMWDLQMPVLTRYMRVLRYDTRGHGQSSVEATPYSTDQLGRDVLALVDSLQIDQFFFCGLSMGGVIGIWLGIHAPGRIAKLVLCSTAAKIGTPETWKARIETAKKRQMQMLANGAMERWFTPQFREKSPEIVEAIRKMIETTSPEGYAACCTALRNTDLRDSLSTIRVPTLVISGAQDPTTPPSDGRFLAEHIAGARYAELNAAHLSNVEDRDNFTAEVSRFLVG